MLFHRWTLPHRPCYIALHRFVDRDGDGYISADDIFALQAMLMQKSEVFLRVRGAVNTVVTNCVPVDCTCAVIIAAL
jgi:hypothetical protein